MYKYSKNFKNKIKYSVPIVIIGSLLRNMNVLGEYILYIMIQ
jgi:hypothetical protein